MESIGNYNILETLSANGPSSVYIARHKKLERKTLLKVYSGGDKTLIERFEREAKIVADLNSDAIVSIYDFGEAEGKYFISMEFVEGYNLNDYLKKHQIDDEQIIDFAYQIAESVAVLHNKGYIHRDLKPENILVDLNNKIKLTDFGITLHTTLNRVTTDGALLGTPLYMSPEQINNLPLTTASDIFALGIIFYQLAAGDHPFEAPQYGEIFAKTLTSNPPPVNSIRPSLPKWFSDLIEKLLVKDAGKRITDAGEIVKIIRSHTLKYQQLTIENHTNSTTAASGSRKWIVAAAAMSIMLIFYYYYESFKNNMSPALSDSLTTGQQQTNAGAQDSLISNEKHDLKENSQKLIADNDIRDNKINKDIPEYYQENLTEHNKETTFLIKTYPWCDIYIDYRKIDTTPMTKSIGLKPGKYLLSLQNPGYPSFSDSITIRPNVNNIFSYNLDSNFYRLDLQVIPWRKIFIDGKYIGTTPLPHPLFLTRDKHAIEIKNNFYETWKDTIDWSGRLEVKRNIVLKGKK